MESLEIKEKKTGNTEINGLVKHSYSKVDIVKERVSEIVECTREFMLMRQMKKEKCEREWHNMEDEMRC